MSALVLLLLAGAGPLVLLVACEASCSGMKLIKMRLLNFNKQCTLTYPALIGPSLDWICEMPGCVKQYIFNENSSTFLCEY